MKVLLENGSPYKKGCIYMVYLLNCQEIARKAGMFLSEWEEPILLILLVRELR